MKLNSKSLSSPKKSFFRIMFERIKIICTKEKINLTIFIFTLPNGT